MREFWLSCCSSTGFAGGAGNYLGTNLGPGGYGAGRGYKFFLTDDRLNSTLQSYYYSHVLIQVWDRERIPVEPSASSDRAVTPRAVTPRVGIPGAGIPRAVIPKVGTHRAVIPRVLQG